VAEAARQTDEELTTTGKSYRLGIGVSWTDHAKYLEKLGLEVGAICYSACASSRSLDDGVLTV